MKKIKIHPLFLILGIIFICMGLFYLFFIYFFVVILHELAHAFVAKKLGYKMNKISLLPFGAGLNLKQNFLDNNDEMLIAIAGPLLNFSLAVICIAFWWINPAFINVTEEFVFANLVTGTINLLPCYPLDGGRIFVALFSKKITRKKALKICFVFNYLFTAILLILFIVTVSQQINHSLLLMAIFIFSGTLESKNNGSYQLLNYPFTNSYLPQKRKININHFAVKSDTELYKIAALLQKNKLNLIYVILENNQVKILHQATLEKLLLKYEFNTKISQLFNKI